MAHTLLLENVSLVRDGREILKSIDWTVQDSERWVVIGPNGAGKSSLLKLAAASLQPTSGKAFILGDQLGGTNVFDLRTRLGFASSALAARIPNSESVLDAVMTASYAITGRWKESYEELDIRRAKRVLAEWQLAEFAERAFGTLSDGEQKRVQLARAVMTDPELLLLDEPVASLDLRAREETVALLGAYASSPSAPAMVMVTHHLEEIPEGFTHALLLRDGTIIAKGQIDQVLTSDLVSQAFDMALVVQNDGNRYFARAK